MGFELVLALLVYLWVAGAMVVRCIAWSQLRRRVGGTSTGWGLAGSVAICGTLLIMALIVFTGFEVSILVLPLLVLFVSGLLAEAVSLLVMPGRIALPTQTERGKEVYFYLPIWIILAIFSGPVVIGLAAVTRVAAWVRIARRVNSPFAKAGAVFAMVHLVLLGTPLLAELFDLEAMGQLGMFMLFLFLPCGDICLYCIAERLRPEDLVPARRRRRVRRVHRPSASRKDEESIW